MRGADNNLRVEHRQLDSSSVSCRSRAIKTGASQGSSPLSRPVGQEPMRSAAIEQSYKLRAVFVVMGVEEKKLLAAMHGIETIVDVEHDPFGTVRKQAQ